MKTIFALIIIMTGNASGAKSINTDLRFETMAACQVAISEIKRGDFGGLGNNPPRLTCVEVLK